MRELKFRVWDKSVEHLYEVQTLIDGGDAIGRYVLNGEMNYIHLCADEIIVEQYTGLKDKNGKEIYEGDIVEFKLTKRLYAVTYRRYDASFILENDEWEETIQLSLDKDDFEVIGNIHENPEALGEPKNTYREEFNRLTHDCSAVFCFGLLAHAMGLSEYHAIDIVKNAKEEHYQKAISLYKSMMDVEEE